MRNGIPLRHFLAVLVFTSGVSLAREAAAQPALHGALGLGGAYAPVANLAVHDTPGAAPLYVQAEAGGSLGPFGRFAHAAHLAVLSGLTDGFQLGFMPSYLLYRRSSLRFAQYGRIGLPIMVAPVTAYGIELGLGGVYFLTAGLGITAEIDFDFYRGIDNVFLPGGRVGAFISYEILPST